ncbi:MULTISPECIES: CDP-diacylglycerol--serine O-phosphatidyltransferase [Paenibacillus]|uniref:CDP-diacylglycerol--serine O-phosphatidyltransferase n=1 Tax=Paenibacillus TaxID=44249 RepID=UPI002FE07492
MKKVFPSVLTLGNLLLGFSAILFIYQGQTAASMMLILLGLFCDFFDGFCARKLNAVSEMGRELDSLADLVTFGIAPAALAYVTSLHEIRVLGAASCLAYVCCGALRLARFNTAQSHMPGFVGMPIPLAAILLIVLLTLSLNPMLVAFGALLLSLLMVSRLSFPSLKKIKPEVAEDC